MIIQNSVGCLLRNRKEDVEERWVKLRNRINRKDQFICAEDWHVTLLGIELRAENLISLQLPRLLVIRAALHYSDGRICSGCWRNSTSNIKIIDEASSTCVSPVIAGLVNLFVASLVNSRAGLMKSHPNQSMKDCCHEIPSGGWHAVPGTFSCFHLI